MSRSLVKRLIFIMFLVLGVGLNTSTASESEHNGDWDFALAPFYLWAVTLDGDVEINQKGAKVKMDFDDIFDNLETIFIVHFESLYQDRLGIMFDINYIDMSDSGSTPLTDIKVDLTATVAELMGYRRWTSGKHSYDLMLGVIYNRVEEEVDLIGTPISQDIDEDWLDPLIAARWQYSINDKWGLSLKAGIGGFGLSSDIIWEGMGVVQFKPWKNVGILAGYRAVGIDYETGSGSSKFIYDVSMYGPVIGLNIIW